MGTSTLQLASPEFQEMNPMVIIQKNMMVYPSKKTERKSLFLSNIDKVLDFDVETVHFFAAQKDFPPQIVIEKFKKALEDALVAYDLLAGRLKWNSETSRLQIDCNAAGVGFVVASSDYALDQIGHMVHPNPSFAHFVHNCRDSLEPGDVPLCVFQLTTLKCGGIAMGVSMNHTTLDGVSFRAFLNNLAALAANKPMGETPCHDRHLLAARSPPRVIIPTYLEFIKVDHNTVLESDGSGANSDELEFNVFHLTAENITRLKEKAKGTNSTARVTSFDAVTAHVWRCKALSREHDPNSLSTLLYAVDIRSRLNPPLPKSFAGNAVLSAYATATCQELEEGSFSRLVKIVNEGAMRVNDEYARSMIDLGELCNNNLVPNGEVTVSSWWKLGFEKVEYPWGKPKYCCPLVYYLKGTVLLLPTKNGDGVNVTVALPPKEMENFRSLFHKVLNLRSMY